LATVQGVAIIYNMQADLILKHREALSASAFYVLAVWRVPSPVLGCAHSFKYSMAYVVDDVCVLRYDNERGKGDHRHWDTSESVYAFTTLERLLSDFYADIRRWNDEHEPF
jgi:hypothetical protein